MIVRLASLALLLASPVVAAPAVTARASKTEVTVGETFTVEVQATGPAGCTFTFPTALAQDSIEIATAPPPTKPAPATPPPAAAPEIHRYRAAVFALGDTRVPPIPVRYRLADGAGGEVRTEAIPIHVVSLLPRQKDEQKLADVRAPVALPMGRAFWIALGLGLALAVALAAWLLGRRRRGAPALAPVTPALAPDVEARRALDALAASGRVARGEYRPFYIALTAVAKRYLERRLAAPIVEMTTAEMLAHLRGSTNAGEMAPLLRDLSGAADRIKFARGDGAAEEAERHLAATRSLVDTLETRLQPATPGAAPSTNGGGRAA